jgi:hypothetical protein
MITGVLAFGGGALPRGTNRTGKTVKGANGQVQSKFLMAGIVRGKFPSARSFSHSHKKIPAMEIAGNSQVLFCGC